MASKPCPLCQTTEYISRDLYKVCNNPKCMATYIQIVTAALKRQEEEKRALTTTPQMCPA